MKFNVPFALSFCIDKTQMSKDNSIFFMFVCNNFLAQTDSFGTCWEVVFTHDKIYCLDLSKKHWASANLWTLASQIPNAKLRLRLCSACGFFNLALHGEKYGQMASVIFQGPDNYILPAKQNNMKDLAKSFQETLNQKCVPALPGRKIFKRNFTEIVFKTL